MPSNSCLASCRAALVHSTGDDSAAESDASSLSEYDTSADPMDRFTVTAPPASTSAADSSAADFAAAQPQQSTLAAGEYSGGSMGSTEPAMPLREGFAGDNLSRMSRASCHDSQVSFGLCMEGLEASHLVMVSYF